MAWTLAEQAEFAALKRHKLCLLLGDGCAMKGLARLLLVERQVERRLDSEPRRKQTAPRACTSAEGGAAAPNRAAVPAAKAECAGRAQRRRPATAARKARAAARLLVFQAAKRKQLARHKLRAALHTALRRHRWQRMWDVFTAYKEREKLARQRDTTDHVIAADPEPKRARAVVMTPSQDNEALARWNNRETLSEADKRAASNGWQVSRRVQPRLPPDARPGRAPIDAIGSALDWASVIPGLCETLGVSPPPSPPNTEMTEYEVRQYALQLMPMMRALPPATRLQLQRALRSSPAKS